MTQPAPAASADDVAAVRRFNRFYTRLIGALDRQHLASPFSLGEMRVLYELAHWTDSADDAPTASDIVSRLGLDAGYVSRMLRDFEERTLIARTRSSHDGRQQHVRLTAKGRRTFSALELRASRAVDDMLGALPAHARADLLVAMRRIETILAPGDPEGGTAASDTPPAFILRDPQPGDLGWVVSRHGALYAREYAWDLSFEVLVARVAADFFAQHDPRCERGWIAERDGANGRENIGSVFLVRHPDREGVAKLRMLLVEPTARGIGLGKRLVDECTRFARESGYHTITLWTNSVLEAARGIYAAAGYRLVHSEPYDGFGRTGLVSETWELTL